MRSASEISYRLRQEAQNLLLFQFPPALVLQSEVKAPLPGLPHPGRIAKQLAGTEHGQSILDLADEVCRHRFRIFGTTLDTGPAIDWRYDYRNKKSTPAKYLRQVPYLDVNVAGDHKNIWELNRHQHLVLLAQAYLLSSNEAYLIEIFSEIDSWWRANPFQRGINWTSALEVAFRAFSWIWVFHLIGDEMPKVRRDEFLVGLYRHGHHLENNLSFYFSPNTHLLGEAVVLHALGHLFPQFPEAARWSRLGEQTVDEQMERQVLPDGAHFELSTYYHVYALDMFLFRAIISEATPGYLARLRRMADFLHNLMGPEGSLPFLGDDDGGRWFHPYGARDQFGRATIATCAAFLERSDWNYDTADLYTQGAWWLGKLEGQGQGAYKSRRYDKSGLCVLQSGGNRIVFDGGGFGPGRAGHSHSDALSVVASKQGMPVLVDPGTYTYVGSEEWRNTFRGTAAHNTIRINRLDQATPTGPFWWSDLAQVRILEWQNDTATAECTYRGFTHRRTVRFIPPNYALIFDEVLGPAGEHEIEQFWHLGSDEARRHLVLGSSAERTECWESVVFSQKRAALCLVIRRRRPLPQCFGAAIDFTGTGAFEIREEDGRATYEWTAEGGRETFTLKSAR